MTQDQINGMVAKLAERMAANPDDIKGWLMLARSYKTMGRYEEAVERLRQGGKARQ
jgi:cytochrome c-type biogenesis protein CcmH